MTAATDYSALMLLARISSLTVILPFSITLFRFRSFTTADRTLWVLIIVSAITELTNEILHHYSVNNMYVTHVFTSLEFLLISLFFIKTISPSKLNYILFGIIIIFFAISGYEFYYDEKNTLDEISTTTEAILFIIYSLGTFFYMLQNPGQQSIFSIPLFWFNTAILLYFSGNLFLFLFTNYLVEHSGETFYELWGIHSVLNIIFYILISVGFWKTKER